LEAVGQARHADLGGLELVAQAGAELGIDGGLFPGELLLEGGELVEVVRVAEELRKIWYGVHCVCSRVCARLYACVGILGELECLGRRGGRFRRVCSAKGAATRAHGWGRQMRSMRSSGSKR